jgi:hypothetical protein
MSLTSNRRLVAKMTQPELPRVVWSGEFNLGGVKLRCHVLNTGQRVIDEESVVDLLEQMSTDEPLDVSELERFADWQRGIESQKEAPDPSRELEERG